MTNNYQTFDAARLALAKGVNLIEASAGTGKTYAIGMLVLRALVELGVPIEKILIVSFTKAATEELKSRIRARLVEAREQLRGKMEASERKVDQTLLDWASSIEDPRTAVNRLQLALYDIDRAGIFTIHGFCQRMLMEQALESGQLFDLELLADIHPLRNQVVDDFWRNDIYPLDPLPCSLLTGKFGTPEQLLASVSQVVGENGRVEPAAGPVDKVLLEIDEAMQSCISWWQRHGGDLYSSFSASLAEGVFKKTFSEAFTNWFREVNDFFAGERLVVPDGLQLLGRKFLAGELNGNKIRGDEKKQAYLAGWLLPDKEIADLITAMDKLVLTFRVKLAEQLQSEVGLRLEQQGVMGFDDLILKLSTALQGNRGQPLQEILAERFSVALIDEFQDTDSKQWHIFSTLFGGGNHYLYLIGDPKQAIYKFRGADIYSYFLAKETAGRLLTLEKNYRSHPFLVEEVNRLFDSRDKPFFFAEETLAYRSVLAAKTEGQIDLQKDHKSLAGMIYCTLEAEPDEKNGRWTSGKAAAHLRRFIVAELAQLLDPADAVLLQGADDQPAMRALAAQDIAILVRSNRQAEEYRQALADASIPAVVASRQSVFQTRECRDLFLLLQAIGAPGETAGLKSAMTIAWFGLSGNQLQELWQDEERWSSCHSRFVDYNQRWQELGFLTMMSGLLVMEDVLPTLARGKNAERSIANISHLLELVQEQESAENLGIGQVLQWLRKMMQDDQSAENAELLLESDEDAVRIVTMHSAKGLEYPVVFCPYLWYGSSRINGENYQISCHDDEHRKVVDLGSDQFEARRKLAAEEEMAEDLRLLYVALTRAKIRCYVCWADVKPTGGVIADAFQSALGYLLFPEGNIGYQQQQEKFCQLAQNRSIQHLSVSLNTAPVQYQRGDRIATLQPAQVSGRSLHTDWQMSSFSAMAALSEYEHEAVSTAVEQLDTGEKSIIPVPGLAAGANFGNVIHDLLEGLSFSTIARQDMQEIVRNQIRQRCSRFGVQADPDDVEELLRLIVSTPLIADGFSLSMLADYKCLKEMGFYFQLGLMVTDRINALFIDETTFAPLGHKQMQGYLTGFVDLICEYQGKYYILDYKTNHLGELLTDYCADKLEAAMQSHNYGLQYWIYTLVLHRHLQNQLPGYRYEEHFGGVKYLFVRGMTPDKPGSGIYATLPDYGRLLELDLILGGEEND